MIAGITRYPVRLGVVRVGVVGEGTVGGDIPAGAILDEEGHTITDSTGSVITED